MLTKIKLIDLHSHTFMSDGVATPIELIRYAQKGGYFAFGITDHVDLSNYKEVIEKTLKLKEASYGDLIFIPGIEITHVAPKNISKIVNYARDNGINWVGVHGETPVEPVMKGTNLAAIEARVNFLAHPGFINEDTIKLAVKNDVWLELTKRGGHNMTNGYIFKKAYPLGAKFIINSDAHKTSELYKKELYINVALGTGMSKEIFLENNQKLYNWIIKNR